MRTSGLFETHSIGVPAPSGKEIKLVFFGDVHRDAPGHADAEWQNFLRYARGLKNAWFIGMGDYLDSTSTSERGCLGHISDTLHETILNDIQELQVQKIKLIAKELDFMRGRIVGLLNGNHYFNFQDGTNTDQRLCGMLGCKYLGVSAFVRMYLNITTTSRKTFDLWLHHGCGAGRLPGGSINRVDQMREHADADVFAMGDDHSRMVVPAQPRLYLDYSNRNGLAIKSRHSWLIRSGSFLKSYTPGKVSYIHDRARGPRNLGHVELLVTPRTNCGYTELEIHGMS